MSRARTIADFGDGIATADIDDGAVTAAKIGSLPAGSVLQVVMGTSSTEFTVFGTSYVDTGLSATITPSSASSKILVLSSQLGRIQDNATVEETARYRLLRDATQLSEKRMVIRTRGGTGGEAAPASADMCYLDSPNTTSAVTYKTQARVETAEYVRTEDNNTDAEMVLMEIAG